MKTKIRRGSFCHRSAFLITATLAILFTSPAQALLITQTGSNSGSPAQPTYQAEILSGDVGQSFSLDWLVPAGTVGDTALPVDLSGVVTFNINDFTLNASGDDTLRLGIDISNTTDLSAYPDANSAIVSFGFGVNPDASASLVSSGSVFNSVDVGTGGQQQFPGGFKQIDVCVFAQDCSGGDVNGGLQAGDSDSFVLDIMGDFDGNGENATGALTLLDFPLKFQGTWGSFETPGQSVPEPGTLALLGLGLVGLTFAARRRRSPV
jgi:hypothetical protein